MLRLSYGRQGGKTSCRSVLWTCLEPPTAHAVLSGALARIVDRYPPLGFSNAGARDVASVRAIRSSRTTQNAGLGTEGSLGRRVHRAVEKHLSLSRSSLFRSAVDVVGDVYALPSTTRRRRWRVKREYVRALRTGCLIDAVPSGYPVS